MLTCWLTWCRRAAPALQLVSGTVALYNTIRAELLPTPSKSHYTFNLRDLSKVVQGLMRADPKSTSTPEQVRGDWAGVWHRCSDMSC